MKGIVHFCCSAMSGAMFDLNPPVPSPMVRRAKIKQANAPFEWAITGGRATGHGQHSTEDAVYSCTRYDKKNVTQEADTNGPHYRLVPTPIRVRDVGSEQRHHTIPKAVQRGDAGRGSLPLVERASLTSKARGTSRRTRWEGSLDEVN